MDPFLNELLGTGNDEFQASTKVPTLIYIHLITFPDRRRNKKIDPRREYVRN